MFGDPYQEVLSGTFPPSQSQSSLSLHQLAFMPLITVGLQSARILINSKLAIQTYPSSLHYCKVDEFAATLLQISFTENT